jgi:hypothetical protein
MQIACVEDFWISSSISLPISKQKAKKKNKNQTNKQNPLKNLRNMQFRI